VSSNFCPASPGTPAPWAGKFQCSVDDLVLTKAKETHPAGPPIFQLRQHTQLPTSLASRWGHREPAHPPHRSPSTRSWAWKHREGKVSTEPTLQPSPCGTVCAPRASTGAHTQQAKEQSPNIKSQKKAQRRVAPSSSPPTPRSHPAVLEEEDTGYRATDLVFSFYFSPGRKTPEHSSTHPVQHS